jgi:actin-related protein 5
VEAVQEAVKGCPEELQPMLWGHIVLTGGCAQFEGIRERLERELRAVAPYDVPFSVSSMEECVNVSSAW